VSDSEDGGLLARLDGSELYAVQFVRDYVQLHFDDAADSPILTCFVMPGVQRFRAGVAERVAEGGPGYADALRAFINDEVQAASARAGTGLVIKFRSGAIILNPTSEELDGPEIAMLSGFGDRAWTVWRPGEDVFAELP
jgi:hypothetical protein